MKKTHIILFLIVLAVLILVPVLFFGYIQNEITELYYGKKSGVLYQLVSLFYPRFFVESQRFNLEFFVSHAAQVIWRFEFLTAMILVLTYFYLNKLNFKTKIEKFWDIEYSEINSKIAHFVVYGAILYYMNDFAQVYKFWYQYKEMYEPILLLKVLHIPLVDNDFLMILFALFVIASISSMMGIFLRFNTVIVALLFVLFQGWNYSFGKINHGFAPLTYIVILLAVQSFVAFDNRKTLLQLIRVTIASCYLMAGLEKLFISQLNWISAATFSTYLLQHPTDIGLWILKSEFLCVLLPTCALIIQLGFVLILFYPKLKNWILISGILFHFGTVAMFGISSYFHPWIITYVFFIDWKSIFTKANFLKFNKFI